MDTLFLWCAKFLKKHTNFIIDNFDEKTLQYSHHIVIFGHPLCQPCKKIMCKIPYLYVKWKIKGVHILFCNVKESKNISISFQKVPALYYIKNNIIEFSTDDEKKIFQFLGIK